MSPRRRSQRPRSGFKPALIGGALTPGLCATGVWAYSAGHLEPIGLAPHEAQAEDRTLGDGVVRVILSNQEIPAYTKIRREHFLEPGKLELRTAVLSKERAEQDGLFTTPGEIQGRVLAQTKSSGYAFRESDFLPEGTRPGLVGGIPAGMRGLPLEAARLRGIADLLPGDRFDLVAAFPMEEQPSSRINLPGSLSSKQAARDRSPKARVEVMVHDGMIVEPLSVRQVPVSTSTLTQGLQVQTKPVEELVIALMPEEVGGLLEALALEVELTVLPRSGRPDDPASRTPDHQPRLSDWVSEEEDDEDPVRFIERIDGSELTVIPVANG